tara:strand:- start:16353 stop:16568 length:216 start_codon:yes stop_codon:yes gene_type:complete
MESGQVIPVGYCLAFKGDLVASRFEARIIPYAGWVDIQVVDHHQPNVHFARQLVGQIIRPFFLLGGLIERL